jgi:hypothetical protein
MELFLLFTSVFMKDPNTFTKSDWSTSPGRRPVRDDAFTHGYRSTLAARWDDDWSVGTWADSIGHDGKDRQLLRDAFTIKLGQNLPQKGRKSLTAGQPTPRVYVCFHMCLDGPTSGPNDGIGGESVAQSRHDTITF